MFNSTGLLAPQIAHAERLTASLETNGIGVDLSGVGTGKTYAAAAIARHAKVPLVVIAPKLVIPMWERVLKEFGVEAKLIINYEKLCRGNTPWLKYKRCRNEDRWLNVKLKFPADSFVVLDEAHKSKGINSLNAGLLIALKRQNYSTLLLSATAATSPLDMRAFAYVTDMMPDVEMKTYKQFCIEAGAEWVGRWGALRFDRDNEAALKKMNGIHHYLFTEKKVASRLVAEDFGDLFPKNHIVSEAYDMGQASVHIGNIYDDLELAIERLRERVENYSQHVLALIIAARRKIELLKTNTLLEMVEDLYDEEKSVVVFVNFTDTINLLHTCLEKNPKFAGKNLIGLIYGEHPIKKRLQDIDDFQADKKRIILANGACGGQSLSLHDLNGRFPRASLINPSFSAINLCQSAGRIHRVEAKTPAYQRIVLASKSIEEHIARKLHSRMGNLSMLNNGDLLGEAHWFNKVVGQAI